MEITLDNYEAWQDARHRVESRRRQFSASRPFASKYAGAGTWTGIRYYAGERIRRIEDIAGQVVGYEKASLTGLVLDSIQGRVVFTSDPADYLAALQQYGSLTTFGKKSGNTYNGSAAPRKVYVLKNGTYEIGRRYNVSEAQLLADAKHNIAYRMPDEAFFAIIKAETEAEMAQ